MNHLPNIQNTNNPNAIAQTALQLLDTSLAFELTPSVDTTGVSTVLLGPPTNGTANAGTFTVGWLWVDALGAIYKCTVAGTSGTWIQIRPAPLLAANKPVAGIPANYYILVVDAPFQHQYWNGGGWTNV